VLAITSDWDSTVRVVQAGDRLVAEWAFGSRHGQYRSQDLGAVRAGQYQHVAVAVSGKRCAGFLDGKDVFEVPLRGSHPGAERGWKLTFGGPAGKTTVWDGFVEGVSVHGQPLSAQAVAANVAAYRRTLRGRTAPPRAVVRARLTELRRTPTPKEIKPYRRALVAHAYRVEAVLKGTCGAKRILSARWAILDDEVLPKDREVGKTYELTIADFEAHEELEGERLVEVELPGVPLYYEPRL
jgi:hypothetical protein